MREKKARKPLLLLSNPSLLCAAEIRGLTGNKQANNEAEKAQDGAEDFDDKDLDEAVVENGTLVT